ncbi:MAG: transcription factor [Candidatus Woesearchaeota archaeon]
MSILKRIKKTKKNNKTNKTNRFKSQKKQKKTNKPIKELQKKPEKLDKKKQLIANVAEELVGEEAVPILLYLRGKTNVSEFKIAQDLNLEIHQTRNILYRLFEHNLVYFKRKKDKIKGWYISYWDFNEKSVEYLKQKIKKNKIEKLKERLEKEQNSIFYMCKNACTRMDFDKATEFNFKCPECGEIMHEQDNRRTIQFIHDKLKEFEAAD